jgi:hypothetical protein
MKYTCQGYLCSARGAHTQFGRIKTNIRQSIQGSAPMNRPSFKFLVPKLRFTAIKLRKNTSLRQGLPQSRSQGWRTLKHIPVTGFQHPCWNDELNLMAVKLRLGMPTLKLCLTINAYNRENELV